MNEDSCIYLIDVVTERRNDKDKRYTGIRNQGRKREPMRKRMNDEERELCILGGEGKRAKERLRCGPTGKAMGREGQAESTSRERRV